MLTLIAVQFTALICFFKYEVDVTLVDFLIDAHTEGYSTINGDLYGFDNDMHKAGVSQHLDVQQSIKQSIMDRLGCHQSFVIEKKNLLSEVLWEVVESVRVLEELAASESLSSTGAAGDEDSKDSRRQWGKALGFRRGLEEKMGNDDFEGVLKMVRSGVKSAGAKIGMRDGNGEGDVDMGDQMRKIEMVSDNKKKIEHGILVCSNIVREMEVQMLDMEEWLRSMEEVLGEFVRFEE